MLQRTPKPFDKIVKQAKRYVTDTIILRIRACYQNKMSRKQFLTAAEAAFAKQLDTELESQVLLAYKKTVPESLPTMEPVSDVTLSLSLPNELQP